MVRSELDTKLKRLFDRLTEPPACSGSMKSNNFLSSIVNQQPSITTLLKVKINIDSTM